MRKVIHIFSAVIPIGYYFLGKEIALWILIPILVSLLLVELLKYKVKFIYNIYVKYFSYLLRSHEYDKKKFRLNGSSWLLIADILCIILFPKLIAITGMLLLSLSDSSSAIMGRVFGKKQYAPNRSVVGTVTFFIVGAAIVLLTPKYGYLQMEYIFGFIAVAIATIVDSINFPTDDNFSIPLSSSFALYLLYVIFLPGVIH